MGRITITRFLSPEDIIPDLVSGTKEEALAELAARVALRQPEISLADLLKILLERERLGSTGIGDGVAIPHGKVKNAKELMLVFGRSLPGVDFNSLDGRPAQLFFLLVAPDQAVGEHLKMLARISRILKDPTTRRKLLDAPDAAAVYNVIKEQDSSY
ncbi:PTS sugar transporter subunit IIA [Geotalea sp. SG265]|uniref:PTS sugar transporter subunit IIA n=1 Tax=Geotalea sp. SG265 TaxID=2922867 RepID=UPI00325FDDDC